MRCPKSRFPIRIIVFDKPELIIFVSQGLTLSTASLVLFIIVRLRLIQSQSLNIYLFLPSKPSLLINVFQCQDCVVFVSRLYFTRTITHCLLSRVYKILRLQIYQSLTKTKLIKHARDISHAGPLSKSIAISKNLILQCWQVATWKRPKR